MHDTLELGSLHDQASKKGAAVRSDNPFAVELVGTRTRRILAELRSQTFQELLLRKVPEADIRRVLSALRDPDGAFRWFLTLVEGKDTYHLGNGSLAVDAILFLRAAEGKQLPTASLCPRTCLKSNPPRGAREKLSLWPTIRWRRIAGKLLRRGEMTADVKPRSTTHCEPSSSRRRARSPRTRLPCRCRFLAIRARCNATLRAAIRPAGGNLTGQGDVGAAPTDWRFRLAFGPA